MDTKEKTISDWSKLFKDGILAHIAIQCSLHQQIKDFELYANLYNIGTFNPVILRVKYQDAKDDLLFIQLKYEKKKETTAKAIFEQKEHSIFNLQEYKKCFDEIWQGQSNIFKDVEEDNIKHIFFTNIKIEKQRETNNVAFQLCNGSNFPNCFNTADNSKIFNIKPKTDMFSQEFLSKCLLFTEQVAATSINKIVEKSLKEVTHDDKSEAILNFFQKWSATHLPKICKSEVVTLLLKHLLPQLESQPQKQSPLIENNYEKILTVCTKNVQFPLISDSNKNILQLSILRAIRQHFKINLSWEDMDKKMCEGSFRVANELGQKFETYRKNLYTTFMNKDFYYFLWENKIVPLLVKCNESTRFRVEYLLNSFFVNLPIVLIHEDNLQLNIRDINKVKKNHNIAEYVDISLQGKEKINLQQLIFNNTNVLDTLTPNIYLSLLQEEAIFGMRESLPEFYIERKLQESLLKNEVLNTPGNIFILKDPKYIKIEEYIAAYKKHKKCIEIGEFEDADNIIFRYENEHIIYSNLSVDESFEALKVVKEKCLYYIQLKSDNYELIKATGPLTRLRNSLAEEQTSVEFKDIVDKDVNIISGLAGTGKTVYLQSIEHLIRNDTWTIFLNLTDHIGSLTKLNYQNVDNVRNFLLLTQISDVPDEFKLFVKEMFINLLQKEKVILLIDNYDNVIFESIGLFVNCLKLLKVKIWITTKPSKKIELENELGTFSLEIQQFDKKDQLKLIEKMCLSKKIDDFGLKVVTEKCENYFFSFQASFIGIPLQATMLRKILQTRNIAQFENFSFNLLNIFKSFFRIYLKEFDDIENSLKMSALKTIFHPNILKSSKLDKINTDSLKNDKLNDIIEFTGDGTVNFIHTTYAEYFCAKFLYDKLLESKKNKNNFQLLYNSLYYKEMKVVRYFFDKMCAENFPLHSAVLNNDLDKVKYLCSKHIKDTDVMERTVLVLACRYGKVYDLQTRSEITEINKVDKHITFQYGHWGTYDWEKWKGYNIENEYVDNKLTIQMEIIEELLLNLPSNDDAIAESIKIGSLEILERFCKLNSSVVLDKLYKKLELIFYYSAKYSYPYLLQSAINFAKGNYVVSMLIPWVSNNNFKEFFNEQPLTHYALRNKEMCLNLLENGVSTKNYKGENMFHLAAKKTLDHLLIVQYICEKQKKYLNLINETETLNGYTPLHFAVVSNNIQFTKLLLLHKVNCNIPDRRGVFPFHLSCFLGHLNIADILLPNVDINCVNPENGLTPLHFAVSGNNSDILQLLLSKKADATIEDKLSRNILHLAAERGFLSLVEILFGNSNIRNINVPNTGTELSTKLGKTGWTPLFYAVSKNNFDVVKFLLSQEIDLHINDVNGNPFLNCLHLACQLDRFEIVKYIVQEGKIRINSAYEKYGKTPLHYAAMFGHLKILKYLLTNHADLIKDEKENNLLHSSLEDQYYSSIEMVKTVLKMNPNFVNDVNVNNKTPLQLAEAIRKTCKFEDDKQKYSEIIQLLNSSGK